MPQLQQTLVASTALVVPLDAPTGRVTLTVEAGAAEVYATADGSLPVIPTPGTEVTGSQVGLGGVLGTQAVLQPPLFGDHMAVGAIRLISAGTPLVLVQW